MVFGYGSLMWSPGFDFWKGYRHGSLACTGRCASIRLCIAVRRSGRVCDRVRPRRHVPRHRLSGRCGEREETIAYLRAREQVTTVYLETIGGSSSRGARRQVRALCFIVDRGHVQYAGRLSLADACITCGRSWQLGSQSRLCVGDGQALEALGYRDTDLHLIAERLKGRQSAVS